MATKKQPAAAEAVSFPIAALPPNGSWEPPEGVKDIAVLVPLGSRKFGDLAHKTGLPTHAFEGLDGEYILSSDGSTRPAEATQ